MSKKKVWAAVAGILLLITVISVPIVANDHLIVLHDQYPPDSGSGSLWGFYDELNKQCIKYNRDGTETVGRLTDCNFAFFANCYYDFRCR